MLMVIFGAGASYDSSQTYPPVRSSGGSQNFGVSIQPPMDVPWRPPLAKDLFIDSHYAFGDIVEKYPKLTHILPNLREPPSGRSVEQVLETLQEESRDDPESQRELASVRYYLCELLHKVTQEWSSQTNGVTNYAPLIRDILRFNNSGEQVCLVTFNYDMLLDRALYTFDFKPKTPKDFLDSHSTLKLFKLHGSVNWSRLVDLPEGARLQPQALIERASTITLSDDFVDANATSPLDMFKFGRPIFPAIAIPVQTKSDQHFECPRSHREYLAGMLQYVTKILIIGWQAKEAHFLRMLRFNVPNLGHVMAVGAHEPDARGILKYFTEQIALNVPNNYVGKGGFTSFIVGQEGHSFLNV